MSPNSGKPAFSPTRLKAATKANGRQDEQDLQDGFCLRPTGDTLGSIESSNLRHPVHPVHPVEKSGCNLITRIVANAIDPDRYQSTAAGGRNQRTIQELTTDAH